MSGVFNPYVNDLTYYSYDKVEALYILEVTASVISVVVGSIAIVLWMRMDPSRRVIFRLELLLSLIISDFFKALFILCFAGIGLNTLRNLEQVGDMRSQFCDGWGFVKETATISADIIVLTLTIHNALMIFKPNWSKIHKKWPTNYKKLLQRCKLWFQWKIRFTEIFTYRNPNDAVYVSEGGVYVFRWYIGTAIITLSALFAGLVFVNHGHYQYNFSCSTPQEPKWVNLVTGWIIRYINLTTIAVVYTTIIIYLMVHFRNIEKTKRHLYHHDDKQEINSDSDHHMPSFSSSSQHQTDVANVTNTLQKELMGLTAENNAKRRNAVMRELKSFAVYPIAYWIIWLTPTISQVYNYVDDAKVEAYGLMVVVAIMVPLSCTCDSIIFFVREKPWNCTTSALERRRISITAMNPFGPDAGYHGTLHNTTTGDVAPIDIDIDIDDVGSSQGHFKPSIVFGKNNKSKSTHSRSSSNADPHLINGIHIARDKDGLPLKLDLSNDTDLITPSYRAVPLGDVDKSRDGSFASSTLSNIRTLVGSKTASVFPNLSSVQDVDPENVDQADGSHGSSSTNVTATNGRANSNDEVEDDDVDMVDFLRGL